MTEVIVSRHESYRLVALPAMLVSDALGEGTQPRPEWSD